MIGSEAAYKTKYSEDPEKQGFGKGKEHFLNRDRVLVVNLSEMDIGGHIDLEEGRKAVTAVDKGLAKIVPELIKQGYRIIISADHGSIEHMMNAEGKPFTSHTANPVPFIYIDPNSANPVPRLKEGMGNRNIAPSILHALGLKDQIPTEWESSIFDSEVAPPEGEKKFAFI